MKKKRKVSCGKITEKDFITAIKKYSREVYGIEAPKIFVNKKKYNRKKLDKINLDD